MSIKTNNVLRDTVERVRILEHECHDLGLHIKSLQGQIDLLEARSVPAPEPQSPHPFRMPQIVRRGRRPKMTLEPTE